MVTVVVAWFSNLVFLLHHHHQKIHKIIAPRTVSFHCQNLQCVWQEDMHAYQTTGCEWYKFGCELQTWSTLAGSFNRAALLHFACIMGLAFRKTVGSSWNKTVSVKCGFNRQGFWKNHFASAQLWCPCCVCFVFSRKSPGLWTFGTSHTHKCFWSKCWSIRVNTLPVSWG